jgi:hypothetical protein
MDYVVLHNSSGLLSTRWYQRIATDLIAEMEFHLADKVCADHAQLLLPRTFVGLAGGVALSHASRISDSSSLFDSFVICTISFADLPHTSLRNISGAASNRNSFRSSGRSPLAVDVTPSGM